MLNRRNFLRATAALGAGAAFAGSTSSQTLAEETMRLFWWGTPDRTKRTLEVAKLFEASNGGVKLLGEAAANDYFSKLTTMIAGGNAPDLFQLEPGRFAEYSRRSTNLPLNSYIGGNIRTDKLVANFVELGSIDEKLMGMPVALNALAMVYDTDTFTKAGVAPPIDVTWDDFAKNCIELTKAIGKKNVWATGSASKYLFAFQTFVTQRGKRLYSDEGKVGFDTKDAEDWYGYWESLTKNGGCTSAELQATDNTMVDANPMTTGNAAIAFGYSNQITAFQSLIKNKLAITALPIETKGGPSGLYYRPSQYWAIAKTAKNPELAAKFIDFFINDPEAGKILGTERGVPVNSEVRNAILPTLPETSRLSVEYINSIASKVGAYPPPVPLGVSEFDERVFRPLSDKVAFGQITPAEAAKELVSSGNRILKI